MGQSSPSSPFKNSHTTQQKLFAVIAEDDIDNERKLVKYLSLYPHLINTMRGPGKGMTPLIAAVMKDQPAKVKLLLDLGAFPDACGLVGTSPLMYACEAGNTVIIKMLLMKGASPRLQDNHGNTSLHHAAMCNKITGPDAVKMILDTQINVNARDQYGRTALHLTCLCHHMNSAAALLENGLIDMMICDHSGKLATDYIHNEPIRWEFEASSPYQQGILRDHCKHQRAFLNVLQTLPSSSYGRGLDSGNTSIIYLVLSTPELSAMICQYL